MASKASWVIPFRPTSLMGPFWNEILHSAFGGVLCSSIPSRLAGQWMTYS